VPGIYGWHFATAPDPAIEANRLLYVGIAPRHMRPRISRQSLRTRIRYHFRGNAAGSTLRLTLGCLIGLELRRVGSGTRMTFGRDGEGHWMRGWPTTRGCAGTRATSRGWPRQR
jgi:hypothetical protein